MSKERKLTPIAAALGATFAVSLMASPITQAAANPIYHDRSRYRVHGC